MTPVTAVVINKNAVIHLPVKIFLDAICSFNGTNYLWVFCVFCSPPVLLCEPVIADLGQTEHKTAKNLLL